MAHATPGRFVWYDHLAHDAKEAIAFYSHVFGWTTQPIQMGYTMFAGSLGPMAGTVAMPESMRKAGASPHWTCNVFVADVDATVALVRELGGRVLDGPNEFPNVGRLAMIADPQGATINLFTPSNPMTLHDASKPGEFVWHELVTTDHEAAFAFYSRLFGWKKTRDFDMGGMGKYLIYGSDGTDLGGMMTKPKDMPAPPHWLYYVEVADLGAAIERAKSNGAKLLHGPQEVPGGAHIAQLLDPQGAAFALHEAASSAAAR
jgi:predicted enzyme related to lactoylglutathione lyase